MFKFFKKPAPAPAPAAPQPATDSALQEARSAFLEQLREVNNLKRLVKQAREIRDLRAATERLHEEEVDLEWELMQLLREIE